MIIKASYKLIIIYLVLGAVTGGLAYANTHTNKSSASVSPTPTPVATVATASSTDTNEIYAVKSGDTLFTIGQQYNVSWTVLAKINDLDEDSVLQIGQELKIPTANENATIQAITDTVKQTQEESDSLASAQQYADAGTGQLSYRLNPVLVVEQSPLLTKYSFSGSDLYVLKSKDTEKGVAVVEVTHLNKLYTVTLNAYQPNKGEKTVWTPVTVSY